MGKLKFLIVSLLLFFSDILADTCSYQNCNPVLTGSNVVNIHLIPHTHDDLGWLKTADMYYTGMGHNLVGGNSGVQYIINTVVDELIRNPKRRFSYCETGYMTRWLEDHTEEEIAKIVNLTKTGFLEFVGGGWVQPDEAASHYVELIDQYSLGLRTLDKYFGNCSHPQMGWQLDPFGHSREHSNILVMMGYKALWFNREHFVQHDWRKGNKSIEFMWQVSDDLGSQIFTHSYDGLYYPPGGFCWDYMCGDEPIVDKKEFENYNVDQIYQNMINYANGRLTIQKQQNHIFVMMGGDFLYANANSFFDNMDRLVEYAESQENVAQNGLKYRILYSTPRCYFQNVENLGPYDVQDGFDFFPYASGDHSYWTGYFTSKPGLKGLVRKTSEFLQLTRSLSSLSNASFISVSQPIEKLERSVGLSQHHDGITGTSKEFVTQDYNMRMVLGVTSGEQALNAAVQSLSQTSKNNNQPLPSQSTCRQINESACAFTTNNQKFVVSVYNGNTQKLSTTVKIPVPLNNVSYTIVDGSANTIASEVYATFNNPGQINNNLIAPYEIHFPVTVDPLGFKTYFVAQGNNPKDFEKENVITPPNFLAAGSISNGDITLQFDSFGFLSSYTNVKTGVTYPLKQDFAWYQGSSGNGQASGAYVFRPETQSPVSVATSASLTYINSTLVQEVRQIFTPWLSQTIRLYPNQPIVEFEWTVGPIPKESSNPISKEIITRYTAPTIANNGVFYTDSNGRQLVQRKRNWQKYYAFTNQEPVAANYFPVNSRIMINDNTNGLVILTDRSEGGASINDGQVELMLHRRDFYDDGYGVDQALDEPGRDGRGLVVRGKHWLLLAPTTEAQTLHRALANSLFHQPVLTFSNYNTVADYGNNYITQYTGIKTALPPQLNLLTLKPISDTSVLIRLEHFYQKTEDATVASVDLANIFNNIKVNSAQELNLQATEVVSTLTSTTVQLNPMQIKTYLLQVQKT